MCPQAPIPSRITFIARALEIQPPPPSPLIPDTEIEFTTEQETAHEIMFNAVMHDLHASETARLTQRDIFDLKEYQMLRPGFRGSEVEQREVEAQVAEWGRERGRGIEGGESGYEGGESGCESDGEDEEEDEDGQDMELDEDEDEETGDEDGDDSEGEVEMDEADDEEEEVNQEEGTEDEETEEVSLTEVPEDKEGKQDHDRDASEIPAEPTAIQPPSGSDYPSPDIEGEREEDQEPKCKSRHTVDSTSCSHPDRSTQPPPSILSPFSDNSEEEEEEDEEPDWKTRYTVDYTNPWNTHRYTRIA